MSRTYLAVELGIIIAVIVLAVTVVAFVTRSLFSTMDAHKSAMESKMDALESSMGSRMDALEAKMDALDSKVVGHFEGVKAAVEAGTREHKVWQDALRETNERQLAAETRSHELMMRLLESKRA